LGRGLSALIREPEALQQGNSTVPTESFTPAGTGTGAAAARAPEATGAVLHLDIDLIDPSPFQPRTRFAQGALDELAQSIRQTGIVQPVVVRRNGPERYQLLAGERRWRAAQLASLHRVPAIVQNVSDEKVIEITLVENLQREDLNAIEQAQAFDRLIQEFHLTQEEAAARTGKERATVTNALRLLRLDKPIREMVEDGRLTGGHARALLAIESETLRLETARRAARGSLTVRQIERLATRTRRHRNQAQAPTIDANTRAAVEELQRVLGTRVTIHPHGQGRPGQIIVEYYTESDLDRLYRLIVER
jgi:ParB family transcriptional regulator, chromosome partitioning protein